MKYIGKYAEHLVLAELLRRGMEAYLAIKANQDDYDITAIIGDQRIVRIQVKASELNNESTNNPIYHVDKNYDYLVLVIVAEDVASFFVIPKCAVLKIKGNDVGLYTTKMENKQFKVRDSFLPYAGQWGKLCHV
ncbi:MAG: hypothetical protein HY935_06050 [Nitrosomonadales bacterium]|nr:hypothetical protein [Nitrosomonadales bacterium]